MTKNTKATKPMNKQSLIASMAELSGLSKADSTRALEAMVQSIQKALKDGNDVSLVGFGTFRVVKRDAREGHNPRTGKKIKIPLTKYPKFRAGKLLKEALA
jgi:nucleoid DNA-binding protein